ncbi:unnamed protein product [Phaedon cochleariae]|uniref:THAP-type domain-containing protein n=1 Tax=Phaedon cochleariae TaxID=80249 RepID=A0A9N9X755_PHACE|nr:unnamed protein product [Phaedon cochleariae]
MDTGNRLLCNSNIEFEVDESEEVQFVSVGTTETIDLAIDTLKITNQRHNYIAENGIQTFQNSGLESIQIVGDIEENNAKRPFIVEPKEQSFHNSGLESMQIVEDIEESNAKRPLIIEPKGQSSHNRGLESMQIVEDIEESNPKRPLIIEPKEQLKSTPSIDLSSIFIIKSHGESTVKKHVPAEKVLHSAPKNKSYNEQIYLGKTGNERKLKRAAPVVLKGLIIKQATTSTEPNVSQSQSNLNTIPTTHAVEQSDIPSKTPEVIEKCVEPIHNEQAKVTNQGTSTTAKAQSSSDVHVRELTNPVVEENSVNIVPAPNQQETSLEVDTTRINPCVIPGCKIYKNEQVYAFKVPENIALLNIWDMCIDKIEAKKLFFNDVICIKHFDKSDVVHNFKIIKQNEAEVLVDEPFLRKGAMPCIHYHTECCVPGCTQLAGKRFTFPVLNNDNLHLWLYMLKNLSLKKLSAKELLRHRVCEIHFEPDCFDEQRELTERAVPTLHLPVKVDPKYFGEAALGVDFNSDVKQCIHRFCNTKAKLNGYPSDLFSLPCKNFVSLKTWLTTCGRSDLIAESINSTIESTKGFGVCKKHFMLQDYEDVSMSKLKPHAVPRNIEQHSMSNSVIVCAFESCYKIANQIKKIYPFPEETERSKSWLQVIRREEFTDMQNMNGYGVCEDHFVKSDFVDGELSSTAIPKTVIKYGESNIRISPAFPGIRGKNSNNWKSQSRKRDPTVITSNTPEVQFISESIPQPMRIHPNTCVYRGCKSKASISNPLLHFPVKSSQYRAWLKACGYKNFGPLSSRYQICSKHFDEKAFDKNGRLIDPSTTPVQYRRSRHIDPPQYVVMGVTSGSIQNSADNNSQEDLHKDGEDSKCDDADILNEIDFEMLCAVENCVTLYKGPEALIHKFPHPDNEAERFEMWLRLVANESLDHLNGHEVHRSYVVCERHFERYFYAEHAAGKRLVQVAVPTLNLVASPDWLNGSIYYEKTIQPHLKRLGLDAPRAETTWLETGPVILSDQEDKTKCILEKDRLIFPGMGCFLQIADRKPDAKILERKFPYKIYRCNKSSYGPAYTEYGENFSIHTAIVIDDDDESERIVMRYLLEKRREIDAASIASGTEKPPSV